MKSRKQRVVTVETRRLMVVHPLQEPMIAWCAHCEEYAEMFTADGAARFLSVTPREIYRRVENGAIHFLERADGNLLICRIGLSVSQPSS